MVSAALGVAVVKDSPVARTAAFASAGAGAALIGEKRLAPRAGPLALFYQEAFSTLRQ
ncbi:hypothetical protein [Streptomyces sp. NPDC006527]|uniref:hypothetical protein n=1 Tax=Streptomyces sp. NPDC006527 TaxID=3364749 RepID=UPI00368C9A61